MVYVSNSTIWRIKNQPSNSTSCSDNDALRLLVLLVTYRLYWGLQVTSSYSIWSCVVKGCFERGIFWRAKSHLKGIEDFNLEHLRTMVGIGGGCSGDGVGDARPWNILLVGKATGAISPGEAGPPARRWRDPMESIRRPRQLQFHGETTTHADRRLCEWIEQEWTLWSAPPWVPTKLDPRSTPQIHIYATPLCSLGDGALVD